MLTQVHGCWAAQPGLPDKLPVALGHRRIHQRRVNPDRALAGAAHIAAPAACVRDAHARERLCACARRGTPCAAAAHCMRTARPAQCGHSHTMLRTGRLHAPARARALCCSRPLRRHQRSSLRSSLPLFGVCVRLRRLLLRHLPPPATNAATQRSSSTSWAIPCRAATRCMSGPPPTWTAWTASPGRSMSWAPPSSRECGASRRTRTQAAEDAG